MRQIHLRSAVMLALICPALVTHAAAQEKKDPRAAAPAPHVAAPPPHHPTSPHQRRTSLRRLHPRRISQRPRMSQRPHGTQRRILRHSR
jgi:hypothetical protein